MPAERTATGTAPPLGRALGVYTALRFGLMAVLSVLAWLAGLAWLPAIAAGVLLAAILSLFVLRGPMRRAATAIAGSRGSAAAVPARPEASRGSQVYEDDNSYGDDPYGDDPYADEEPGEPGQDASSSATPTSRP